MHKRSRWVAADVTEQLVDVESRIATQRASVERIRALLARAASVSEITSVESELTSPRRPRSNKTRSNKTRRDGSREGGVAISSRPA